MAKYKVIGEKLVKSVDGQEEVFYGPIELTNQVGIAKGKVFKWDPGTEVTNFQVSDEDAKKLVEEGKLEVIEAPESWVEKTPE